MMAQPFKFRPWVRLSFRLRCFIMHLMVSGCIVLGSLFLVFGVWYPPPLNKAAGVDEVILILFLVDLVVGPLLTLILAKQGKRGLWFDFMVIAVIQIAALTYGMHSIAKGRPVYISFYHSRFELVQDYATRRKTDEVILPQYSKNSWLGYEWVAVRSAKNDKEQEDWLFAEFETGTSPAARPVLYEPMQNSLARIMQQRTPLQELDKYNDQSAVQEALAAYPTADGYLPLRADTQMTVFLDSKHKEVLGIVDLRPE